MRSGEDANIILAFYACPAAPMGCGKAGPSHEDTYADQAAAAALWDAMRKKEKANV